MGIFYVAGAVLTLVPAARADEVATRTEPTSRADQVTAQPGPAPEPPADPTPAPPADPAADARPSAETSAEIIVITGTRVETPLVDVPVATEVVTRAQIERTGARSVAEALALRPGLELSRSLGATGITLQGLGPEYTLILVDGQRMVGRIDGAIDLERFATSGIEQIEIVRGPSSALYGADALGGVINLVTRQADTTPTVGAAVTADSLGGLTGSAQVDGGIGRWAGSLDGGWRHGDGWDLSPGEVGTTAGAFDDGYLAARGDVRGARWRVGLGADYQQRDVRGVDAVATGAIFDRRNLTETAALRLLPRIEVDDATTIRGAAGVAAFRDQFVSDQRGSAALDQDQQTRELGVDGAVQLEHRRGDHRGTIGAEAAHESLTSDRLAGGAGDRQRLAGFIQDEWRPGGGRVLLAPAVRIDHASHLGTHATPRLAVRLDATDDVVIRASHGWGFRAPSFKEQLLHFENPGAGYVVDGNPDLDPETSRSWQLGVEWRPVSWLWLVAGGYRNDVDDLIDTVEVAGDGPRRFTYVNVASAHTQGVETQARLDLADAVVVDLGYTLLDSEDEATGLALPGRARHRATIDATWRPGWELEATGRAALSGSRTFPTDRDGDGVIGGDELLRTDPELVLAARLARRFADEITVFIGADNLAGAGDELHTPIAPRSFYAGASVRHDL